MIHPNHQEHHIMELLNSMEATLVKHSSQVDWTELMRIQACYDEVETVATAFMHIYRRRDLFSETEYRHFAVAKQRIMVYLVYYYKISGYHSGTMQPDYDTEYELYFPGKVEEWRSARKIAGRLFKEYVRTQVMVLSASTKHV